MKPYIHKVQYYETDKMGITHHANYLHWMEEARVDFLDQLGWSYARLEELGVTATVRRSLGGDIDASCGQLRRKAMENGGEQT